MQMKALEEENIRLKESVDKLQYELLGFNNILSKYKEDYNVRIDEEKEKHIKQMRELKDILKGEAELKLIEYKDKIKKLEDKIQLLNEELGKALMESKFVISKKESLIVDNESLKNEVINLKKVLKTTSPQLEYSNEVLIY